MDNDDGTYGDDLGEEEDWDAPEEDSKDGEASPEKAPKKKKAKGEKKGERYRLPSGSCLVAFAGDNLCGPILAAVSCKSPPPATE